MNAESREMLRVKLEAVSAMSKSLAMDLNAGMVMGSELRDRFGAIQREVISAWGEIQDGRR